MFMVYEIIPVISSPICPKQLKQPRFSIAHMIWLLDRDTPNIYLLNLVDCWQLKVHLLNDSRNLIWANSTQWNRNGLASLGSDVPTPSTGPEWDFSKWNTAVLMDFFKEVGTNCCTCPNFPTYISHMSFLSSPMRNEWLTSCGGVLEGS